MLSAFGVIETLMKLHGKSLDWELVRQYFKLFDLTPLFAELERKYHAPQ